MDEGKSILIKNIYYMLTYAFQILRHDNYEEIAVEHFDNVNDMFAAILGKGVAKQLKQGLYKEYLPFEDDITTLRGRLDITGTIKNRIAKKQRLRCQYDELSVNNLFNRIIKTTMKILVRHSEVKQERKDLLKKNLLYFDDVNIVDTSEIRWSSIRFHKNNQDYRMLINVCNLVLEGMIISTEKGQVKWASFIDEQRMCRLYERFILEYYRYHHPYLHPNADQIPWIVDDGIADFLPIMQTDITLRQGKYTLIIDAKYYSHNMQNQYDTHTVHSNNLYQIFTYVKNLDVDNTGRVAGVLLYARTTDKIQPDYTYKLSGNEIKVKTIDLNCDFEMIKKQLDGLVNDYFCVLETA